jgi:CarD family transcriptional regulator
VNRPPFRPATRSPSLRRPDQGGPTIPGSAEAEEQVLEDLDVPEIVNIDFEVGDNVVYPHHGAGKVLKKELRKMFGDEREYVSEMPKNWNRRFKHNRDKIKTGDIYELAEVVRNLAIREHDKGLSTGEKQMFTRAKKILASELMYALEKSEDDAEAYLDDLLTSSAERLAAAR